VVDVLSFTTTLTVAVERGIEVFPFGWRDERAAEYAGENDTVLAVQRQDSATGQPSLSPASLRDAGDIRRLVLPSPNGSTISSLLAEGGATVVGASLRNRRAVAEWLTPRCVRQCGRRRPRVGGAVAGRDDAPRDRGSLGRAGAVLDALGSSGLSSEAAMARDAFSAADLPDAPHACAGGRELTEKGYAADVVVASESDTACVVPMLRGRSFRAVVDGVTDQS
jgi:2-phosphosulfolactate phosphatase